MQMQIVDNSRPLYISEDLHIFYESFTEFQIEDFLNVISEPKSRPLFIHEFIITEYSLTRAVLIGLNAEKILDDLQKFCKHPLPEKVVDFIGLKCSNNYLYLEVVNGKYFLRSTIEIVEELRENDGIIPCIKPLDVADTVSAQITLPSDIFMSENNAEKEDTELLEFFDDDIFDQIDPDRFIDASTAITKPSPETTTIPAVHENLVEETEQQDKVDLPEIDTSSDKLEISPQALPAVKQVLSTLSYPLIEQYDYKNDSTPKLNIHLKSHAKLRTYQQSCLEKVFSGGMMRSGIIVLPCGSGKTLVGVTAGCTIQKSVLVLCNSSVSVEQWTREFKFWSDIDTNSISKFSSQAKECFTTPAGILVSTYTMIAFPGKRSYEAQKVLEFVKTHQWGVAILDEVHVVPADMFKKTLDIIKSKTRLGLTATLVREDEKIKTLNHLVGPKLYEANWSDLASQGFIAKVQCTEVWCEMTRAFFREYLHLPPKSRKRQLLYIMNPTKIQACQYLIEMHETMGDKVIVFSDNIFAIKHYSQKLGKPMIYGGTSQSERIRVLQQFRFNPALNCIFLSKIGDTSIDLPEASCLIQISSHYGSRRQEAQRLGRILRPKKGNNNAHFYSLVSSDTEEMYFAHKRQRFLVDQGYEFRVVTNIGGSDDQNQVYKSVEEQLSLLNTVLLSSETQVEVDLDEAFEESDDEVVTTRQVGTLASLSGTDNMAYMEYNRGTTSGLTRGKRLIK